MCQQEVDHAANNNKRLIPVLWRSVDSKDLPPALAPIQWISLSDHGFETSLNSLIRILNVDLDWVRSHTRLLVRAREWELKGRDDSFVLRGMDLQDAIRWQAQAVTINEPKPSELQQQYIGVDSIPAAALGFTRRKIAMAAPTMSSTPRLRHGAGLFEHMCL
jgi:hypothetical protein